MNGAPRGPLGVGPRKNYPYSQDVGELLGLRIPSHKKDVGEGL